MSCFRKRWRPTPAEELRRELLPFRGISDTQRATMLRQVCRAAAQLLAARTDRARVLAWSDPLPPGSKQALARLRREARE